MNPSPSQENVEPTAAPLALKVFGVGGAGGHLLRQLLSTGSLGPDATLIGTDARALAASPVPSKLLFETKPLRGMGTGSDPERGRALAEAEYAQLKAACAGAELVFIFAGLGGGTGTGVSPVLARAAREAGALVLAFVTLPFECEGGWRMRQAQKGLERLRLVADGVVCLPNQKGFKLIDENTPAEQSFQRINEFLADAARGVHRLVTRDGFINVKFGDLCAAVRGRHAESAFATVEAAGDARARAVWEQLLAHPLLEDGQALAEAATVLVSIVGGPDLSMAEVNRVMEQLHRHCESARVILGAAVDPALGGRLCVTVIATRRNAPPEDSAPEEESADAAAFAPEADAQFLTPTATVRPPSRFVAPPPPTTPEKVEQLLNRQSAGAGRGRRKSAKLKQTQLPLEIVSKGRFDKSEPTIRNGEDLDVPTYRRRGVPLN